MQANLGLEQMENRGNTASRKKGMIPMESVLKHIDREQNKMRSDIDNLYRHYEQQLDFVRQYIKQTTEEWARLLVSHPSATLLIVETTKILDEHGYTYGGNEPIRLTTYTLADGTIWDQKVRPTLSHDVVGDEYHGLTMPDLEDQPDLMHVWLNLVKALEDRQVIVFGVDFAREALRNVAPPFTFLDNAYCLHNKCREYYGEFYELPLVKVLGYQGIDKKREDLKDSRDRIQMLAQVIRNLAQGMEKVEQRSKSSDDDLGDLNEQPF